MGRRVSGRGKELVGHNRVIHNFACLPGRIGKVADIISNPGRHGEEMVCPVVAMPESQQSQPTFGGGYFQEILTDRGVGCQYGAVRDE